MDERTREAINTRKSRLLILLSIAVIIVLYLVIESGSPDADLYYNSQAGTLTFSYMGNDAEPDPIVVDVSDIQSVTYTTEMDLGKFVSGVENRTFFFGQRENDIYGKYWVCCEKNVRSFAVMRFKDGYIVFNHDSDKITEDLVAAVLELMEETRLHDRARG